MAIIKTVAKDLKRKRDMYYLGCLFSVLLILLDTQFRTTILAWIGFFAFLFLGKQAHIYALGYKGEKKISKIISKAFGDEYILFNEIVFSNQRTNNTAQLDHILIGKHVVFSIETKNYTGVIQGTEDADQWTRTAIHTQNTGKQIIRSKRVKKFYNPIKQNHTHKRVLETVIGDKSVPVINLVVFADKNVLLGVVINNGKQVGVLKFTEMVQKIKNFDSMYFHKTPLTLEQKQTIIKNIENNKLNK